MTLDYDSILTEYMRLRKTGMGLNSKLAEIISKEEYDSAFSALNIPRSGNTVIFDSENDIQVIIDFAIHSILTRGKSLLDRCAEKAPFDVNDDEIFLLKAMAGSYYTVLRITSNIKGVGFYATDPFSKTRDDIFIAETLLSQMGLTNVRFASRIIPMGDYYMTGGSGLPVDANVLRPIENLTRKRLEEIQNGWTRKGDSIYAAKVIRLLLKEGAPSRVGYGNVGENVEKILERLHSEDEFDDDWDSDVEQYTRPEPKVGRNAPCPCGSGKKYKKCCGRG